MAFTQESRKEAIWRMSVYLGLWEGQSGHCLADLGQSGMSGMANRHVAKSGFSGQECKLRGLY